MSLRSRELARVRKEQRGVGDVRKKRRLTRLAPGENLETRGVLAGAYHGRDIGERELLTHAVLVDAGQDVRTLCSQPVENMADRHSVRLLEDLYEAPTCPVCYPKWARLQELRMEEMQDMERNGSSDLKYHVRVKRRGIDYSQALCRSMARRGTLVSTNMVDANWFYQLSEDDRCSNCAREMADSYPELSGSNATHVRITRDGVKQALCCAVLHPAAIVSARAVAAPEYYGLSESEQCDNCTRLMRDKFPDLAKKYSPNPRRPRAAPLLEGEVSTGRIRGTSGRFQSSTACDFCGKSCAAEHFTDERACGGGDGPGFFLCGRAACEKSRERLEDREGFDALVRHYAEQRSKNDAQVQQMEEVYVPPVAKRSNAELSKLMGSREGALLLADEKGHSMSPWEGNRSECTRCGASMTFEPGFGASGSAIQRGSKCEMRSNGALTFEQAKARRDELEAELKHWTTILDSYPKSRLGLTDESAKSTPEWKHAKSSSDRAFRALQNFNVEFTRVFKNELADERRARRASKLTPNSERRYYVWVILSDGTPKDEGPYGPFEFLQAKDMARIGATEGSHDRAVSIGRDPQSDSFHIARQYRRGTGERVL